MLINEFRKFCIKWYCVSPLTLVFTLFSCQSSEIVEKIEPEIIVESFSGEDIFRAIFFFQGEIVESLPSLQKNKETIQATFNVNPDAELVYEEFTNQIIEKVKVIDPNYFIKFKSKISSENLYQIEEVINSAKNIIKDAGYLTDYKSIFKLSDELESKEVVIDESMFDPSASKNSNYYLLRDYLNDEYGVSLSEHGFGDANACCLYVLLAVGAVIAAVAVVAAAAHWVYAGVEFWGPEPIDEEGRAGINRQRELIAEISNLLN